ncbi:hypothetical protein HS088_TW18G00891 [Tripterygium wilfordii]|uniref:Uncharacterized protein n=1 Tax=Tripterygium wilfordii TaxID=458696 RepID=A0A7J7CDN5_TRIWF|nr:uncharacterized protein LOC119984383 [Tripterygium wilfordii]KAF5732200.1 hypothetical protein HS088_TW18G00891 [Tripterygium wilfordii]
MSVSHQQTETNNSTRQIPLIEPVPVDEKDPHLSKCLNRLETFLRLFGFCQDSCLSFSLSWILFLVMGVAVPVFIIHFAYCSNCEKYEIKRFELEILAFQCLAAAVSLICISHNLRKYGVRRFLFVDRCHGHMAQFREEYANNIHGFFRLLAMWVLPCFLVKVIREVACTLLTHPDLRWQAVTVPIGLIASWAYSTTVFLSGCALFNLVCNLQVIHFQSYGNLLERDLDVSVYIEEHIHLTHYLSKISHRFRIYLVLGLLLVTASQFMALVETTGNRRIITFVNAVDFAVSSLTELVGIIICLHAAAKITSRAQAIAAIVTKWNAIVTCNANDTSQVGLTNSSGNLDPDPSLPIMYAESDLEAVDYVPMPTDTQLASYMSLYQKRQAFVSYIQSNPGGFTVFGWVMDRALINTVFFVQMSLVLFVLGKTITITIK